MASPKNFFEKCLKEISKEKVIIDVGGGTPFQKNMAPYKSWFENSEYITVDQEFCNPTVVADIHDLPFDDCYADAAICKAVLEHVYDPLKVVSEMHRVLKKNGRILVWLPFLCPYHGNDSYKDYYRYTKDGVAYLFRDFLNVQIVPSSGFFETMMAMIPIINRVLFVGKFLDKFIKIRNQCTGFYVYGTK